MIFKNLLLIILLSSVTKNTEIKAKNQTLIENVINLYKIPKDIEKLALAFKKLSEDAKNKENQQHIKNKSTESLNNNNKTEEEKPIENTTKITNKTEQKSQSTNHSNIENNKSEIPQKLNNSSENSPVTNSSNISSNKSQISYLQSSLHNIANIYLIPSSPVIGIYNCTFFNTINITDAVALPNGSYIHNNHTLIPPHLVGDYNYEILYNGTKVPASLHKRACICRVKRCITLCSDTIPDFYEDSIRDNADEDNDEEDDAAISTLFNINMTLANQTIIAQNIATDFEHIVLDEFCEPFYFLAPQENENLGWTLFENGSLLRQSDGVQLRKNEYCFEFYQKKFDNETYSFINPLSCAIKVDDLNTMDKINYWFQVFSIPFFLATFIGYCCLSELRNVHGKCFMTYLTCLTLSYAILSYINLSKRKFNALPCHLMGYLNHYMQLSHYTWLAIICYDTWRSLNDITYTSSYSRYSVYGFYIPFLMTLMTYVAQKLEISNDWKPGITKDKCGLKVDTWAASIYLYGPCFIILIYCLTMFVLTSRIIKNNDQEVVSIKLSKSESPKSRYTLYLRLFLLMGLSWFIDIVSYLCTMFDMNNLSGVIDCINALQGLYIFVNFIGRRRVRNIIKVRLLLHIE